MKSKLVLLSILFAALFTYGAAAQEFDILIRNGKIADGTGNPSFHGDVGIKDGRIAALGKLGNRTAARVIDAAGRVVTPGFLDMHNHSDNSILDDGDAQSMIRMGVTSMILGEGSSAAPSDSRTPGAHSVHSSIRNRCFTSSHRRARGPQKLQRVSTPWAQV